jgi:hypothetical protein
VHSDPARPSTLNPQLNEKVDAVIMRGLAKAPGSRWATCEAFVNALAAALGAKAAAGVEKTVAMAPAPAVDRTIAMGAGAHDSEGLFAPPPTTAPPPVWAPAVAAKRRARRRRIAIIVIAIVALLALIGGTVSLVLGELFKPTLSLSSPVVEPGSILTVSAGHLPANQVGQIELLSQLYSFPFSADANGSVSQQITIPRDIGIGAHHVSVCWGNACPLKVPLTVVAPGTLPTPPSTSPSPSASGTPVARRSPSPRPTPTPTLNPCPTPTSGAVLKANPTTVLIGGGTVTITGTNFTPNKSVTVRYYKGGSLYSTKKLFVGCNGSFSTTVTTPSGAVRTDHVTATDTAGRTASATISIIL